MIVSTVILIKDDDDGYWNTMEDTCVLKVDRLSFVIITIEVLVIIMMRVVVYWLVA